MATRQSGPRRRPAPPHVQENATRAQHRQPPAPRRAEREASMRVELVDKGEGWLDAERGERILRGVSMVDAGDVDIRTVEMEENFHRITEAAAFVRSRCRGPVFAGRAHAITLPLVRAFDDRSLTVVQFDAHQDYSDR